MAPSPARSRTSARTSRVLGIQAVRGLVEDEQLTRAQHGGGKAEPLTHTEEYARQRLRAAAPVRRVQRRIDAMGAGPRINGAVGRIEAHEVGAAGQVR